jgi:uncharacterized membrane protein
MFMQKAYLVLTTLIIFSFALSVFFYPKLPAQMVIHWNAQGIANGYSSKELGLFLFPILMIIMFAFFIILPKLDPMRANVKKFWGYFVSFVAVLFSFLLYLQVLVIQWNRGVDFDFVRFLMPAFSVLFFSIGLLLEKSRRNWFIGIRTPWTLSSGKVWEKTHKLAAPLFKIAAMLMLAGIVWPSLAFVLLFGGIMFVAFVPVVYSYSLYKKNDR